MPSSRKGREKKKFHASAEASDVAIAGHLPNHTATGSTGNRWIIAASAVEMRQPKTETMTVVMATDINPRMKGATVRPIEWRG